MQGRTVIVGIGNPLRGDDGFGPALIERLKGEVDSVCIDAGSAPENHLGRITREAPDNILLVDVAHMGLEPGSYRLLRRSEILECGLTTHDLSSHMVIEYLEQQTGAEIMMLGVQPEQLSLGEPLSPPLAAALDEIEQLIREGRLCLSAA